MLRSLAIRNFTIIDELELEFDRGFGAITGETGTGKSILIDALAQLLGERADASLAAEGSDRADLSASFELAPDHPARNWLEEQALDDETLILRRVIPASGASRAWINGQPAAVGQLRELGSMLVEIHGQNEHQQLMAPSRQRAWLDRHVDRQIRDAVTRTASEHGVRERELAELLEQSGSGGDLEFLRYQLAELDDLALQPGEFEQLESSQRRLASVDELQQAYATALSALDAEDDAATAACRRAHRALESLADRESALADVLEMLETARVNLDEASAAIRRLGDQLQLEPDALRQIEQRMSLAISLSRKHGIEPSQIPETREALRDRLDRMSRFETLRAEAEMRLAEAEAQWREASRTLSNARSQAAERMVADIHTALGELGMSDAKVEFRIDHDPNKPVSASGADDVEILFSANPGQSPAPLRRVASGGELSRFSLALIIASGDDAGGKVRIFDEIDAGVGGETAHAVGRFVSRASSGGQAFCVTHLAQVAACADQQFQVIKKPGRESTRVAVRRLDTEQRVVELARMLGAADAETGREHARAMLTSAQA